jgi:glycosyltransferase involved in cell wall biosynthesis
LSGSADLTIVIPTRERWPILRRTLHALTEQTVSGFNVVIVVDGEDQHVPDLAPWPVVVIPTGGSARARNAGVAQVHTSLTMLLDDDMVPVPDLVERHLAHHRTNPETEVGVVGRVRWHPDLRSTRVSRWLDWGRVMFDFESMRSDAGADVGWGRFYSCNVSFKTALFRSVGGFDETFLHYYEDTDLAKRLGDVGLRLLYEPNALTYHLQEFDWASVQHRFDRVAIGERLMTYKHPDFEAWYLPRMQDALNPPSPSAIWSRAVDVVPRRLRRMRSSVEPRANRVYLRRLAPSYVASYRRAGAVVELMRYLGDKYDSRRLIRTHDGRDRRSELALYRWTERELRGIGEPLVELLLDVLPPPARVLHYACGSGADGIALGDTGHVVSFADVTGASTRFLQWRLEERGRAAEIHATEAGEPHGFDAVVCSDLTGIDTDPMKALQVLEATAEMVAVGVLEPDEAVLGHIRQQRVLREKRHPGLHVFVYEPAARRAS